MIVLLLALGMVIVVGGMLGSSARGTRPSFRHRAVLDAFAARLSGARGPDRVDADYHGADVTLRLGRRPDDPAGVPWTFVECALPRGYPLAMLVRRYERHDAAGVHAGRMLDVTLGDPAFDAAFLVEAAPAPVVARLLTHERRGFLLRRQIDLSTNAGKLVVAMRGWPTELEEAFALATFAVELAASVCDAVADLDEASMAVAPGSAIYREIPDDRPVQAARAARDLEVARVAKLREQRETSWFALGIGVLVMLLLAAWSFGARP